MPAPPPTLFEEVLSAIKGIGTTIVAYSAFILVIGRRLYETYLVKPTVDIVPSGPVEIGLTIHGPVIGMRGTTHRSWQGRYDYPCGSYGDTG